LNSGVKGRKEAKVERKLMGRTQANVAEQLWIYHFTYNTLLPLANTRSGYRD
jgi:hypothetical protein